MYNLIVIHVLKSLFRVLHFWKRERSDLSLDPLRSQRILLVMTTAVGDTLMCTPAVRAVRKSLPEARISVLVDRRRLPLLRENPHIDQLISYPGKFRQVSKVIRELRRVEADLSIILHGNDPDIVPLIYLSRTPLRVGWSTSQFAFLLTHPVEKASNCTSFVEQRLNTLAAVGIPPDGCEPELYLPENAPDELARKLAFDEIRGPLLGFHPFASIPSKTWPRRLCQDFLKEVTRVLGATVFIVGGQKERNLSEAMSRIQPSHIIPTAGKLSLLESASLLRRCHAMVTTDSGPLHICRALGVPTVALMGPYRTPYPVNNKYRVIQATLPCQSTCRPRKCKRPYCMEEIKVDIVLSETEKLLNRNN